MPFAIGLALALSSALGTSAAAESTTPVAPPVPQQAATIREQVESYFADAPIMVVIAGCESHYRQFNTAGGVYRGEQNHLDVGVMQVNEHYHADTADKLGIDLYTVEGNLTYARYLYEREGTAPWNSSKGCWGPYQSKKTLATVQK